MASEMRPQSKIVAEYIEAAGERDSAILIERDWIERALVSSMKMSTNLATMRLTVHWVSRGRQPSEDIKEHCEKWLNLRYKVFDCVFRQSLEEQRASTPLALYFHCVCRLPDGAKR